MAAVTVPALKLNNGVAMPALGLGVFQSPPEETAAPSEAALRRRLPAHRHRRRLRQRARGRRGDAPPPGLDRSEVFLETKIWISDYGYDETLHGFEKSAGKLGVEQIDLLILHQALPSAFDRTLEAYRALETLLADGKVRAIGVSNFMVDHLTQLLDRAEVVPAVNQIEHAPLLQPARRAGLRRPSTASSRRRGRRSAASRSTATAATPARWRTRSSSGSREAHGKSPAQVMLRWGIQHGRSVIPKSTKPERIAENIDVFDFELSADELAAIDALDTGRRGGPEPEAITLEAFGRDIPEA